MAIVGLMRSCLILGYILGYYVHGGGRRCQKTCVDLQGGKNLPFEHGETLISPLLIWHLWTFYFDIFTPIILTFFTHDI